MASLFASPAVQFAIVCLLGSVFGSFATALSWRVPRGLNWISGRSRCTVCETALGVADLVPLFSWLAFRGKCRHCGAGIGTRYLLIELSVLAVCFGVYSAWGFSVLAFIIMATVPFLTASLVVDIDSMILPDELTLVSAFAAALFVAFIGFQHGGFQSLMLSHAGAAVLFAGLTWAAGAGMAHFLKKEALGFGDVKLMAVAGLWLGAPYLPVFFILAGGIGIIWGAAWRFLYKEPVFPFGPALILSLYICLILQGINFNGRLIF